MSEPSDNTEPTLSIEDIEREMAELDGTLDKLTGLEEPVKTDMNLLDLQVKKVRREYLARIEALQQEMESELKVHRKAQEDKHALLIQAEKKRRELASRRDELARSRADALKLQQAQESLALVKERWDKMLIGVKWREWAKDHQLIAAKQIAQEKKMILADEMGLGKTLEAIMALDFIKAATEEARPDNPYEPDEQKYWDWETNEEKTKWVNGVERPSGLRVLYLCPSSLVRNVVSEFRTWAPHRSIVPIGNMPESNRMLAFEVAKENPLDFVMVLNYEAWRFSTTLIPHLSELNFDTIILDEAHYLKDTRTTVFKGIKQLIKDTDIGFVLPMTGTPILNKPEELYPLLFLLDPARYYSKQSFLDEFCRQVREYNEEGKETVKWDFKPGGLKSLAKRLGKKYMARTKTDAGIELPPQSVQYHDIPVIPEDWPEQARARKSMRQNAFILLNKMDDFGNNKALIANAKIAIYTRLRQIETWPAGIELKDLMGETIETLDIEESQKLDYVINGKDGLLPSMLENNRRVIVFSQFTAPLREIRARIEALGYRAAVLTGETDLPTRNAISRDFDKKFQDPDSGYKYDVALCHYRVGGEGLNLTAATETIILDEQWNPGKRDQAYARTHRMGQDEATTVHVLRMQRTIDDWMAEIMEKKEKLVEGFNKAMTPDVKAFINSTDESGLL